MEQFAHLAARLFGAPLAITWEHAQMWERALTARIEGTANGSNELDSRVSASERLQALARDSDARVIRDGGYALTDSGIAVVPVHGGLVQRGGWMEAESGIASYNAIARTLRAAERNPDVNGIVLDIDSPGGEVAGMFELADMIRGSSKPTRAVANEKAASAAYLLGSAAERLYATSKTAWLGSIGILMMHADRSKAHEKQGVRYTPVASGSRKVEGSSLAPLTADARRSMQGAVDSAASMFFDAVGDYRNIGADAVRDLEGAVMQASEAESAGLIDGVATLGQVIQDFAAGLESPSRTEQRPRAAASAEIDAAVANAMRVGLSDLHKGATMNDPKQAAPAPVAGITPEQLAAERSQAAKAAADAMQARILGIIGHAEAQGRGALAQHFAFKTELSVEDAAAAMAAAPKEVPVADPTKKDNPFAKAMGALNNPDVAATMGKGEGGEDTEESVAARIVAVLPRRNTAAK